MAFPNDLTDVVAFKIHPAIGIARVANSEDFFVFGTKPDSYKSNGLMKRQAVQFRIFAYGANNVGLGELTKGVLNQLNLHPVWSADVANRKLEFTASQPGGIGGGAQRVFGATASSDDASGGKLVGELPAFAEGQAIPLGQITSEGVFIPPKGGVFRETPGTPVPDFPMHTARIADSTSDGVVRVKLNGAAAALPVVPAWIVVAPQDFSPDVDPEPVRLESLLVRLKEDIATDAGSTGSIHNEAARRIDELSIKPATGDFNPGFEVSFGARSNVANVKALFYDSNSDPLIDPREMRVREKSGTSPGGAVPGQLTSGLCSPWQTDFTACIGYWSENLPTEAYLDEDTNTFVSVYRRSYANTDPFTDDRLTSGDDFTDHQDKIGIVREQNGKQVETERQPGDDIPA